MATKRTVKSMLKKTAKGVGKDKLWFLIKEKFEIGMELRKPYEQKWLINLSFLGGKQYTFYNQAAQLLQHIAQRKGRLRVVDNKILPRYQKQISRLIRNNPRMSVVPSSTDQEDIKAAKVGDKVLKSFWRQGQMRKKIRELGGWIYSCGNGFLDDRWNPKAGPETINDKGEVEYLGDVECGVWSPFEIGVPASGLNDCDLHSFPWMWKAKFRPLEYFSRYKRGGEVSPETRPIPFVDTAALFGTLSGAVTAIHKLEGAIEIQLYIQPNTEFPKGLFIIGANGIVLEQSDYPFNYYHMEHFKDIEIPGVFHGMATTEAAIWLQKIWNRTLGDIAEFNRVMARGKWLIPRNAKVETLPDDSHGQRILYNPVMGHKPEMMTIKGLPATYQQTLMIVASSLMELYHQHEVTQGTNKSDIRSGEMVALLLEQDDFGNVPTHAIFEEGLEACMGRVLRRIQKGYTTARTISVSGRSAEYEVFNFKGADLKNNTDVHVLKESSLPDSKIARQFRIKENYKEGLYGSPEDERTRERVLRMLEEVPDDIQDIFKESHLDRQNAKIENYALTSQPEITHIVNLYDNHAVHIEEHNLARKQPEYQKLKVDDMKKFLVLEVSFQTHIQQHQQILSEQMKAQEERMARLEAKGGSKGGK